MKKDFCQQGRLFVLLVLIFSFVFNFSVLALAQAQTEGTGKSAETEPAPMAPGAPQVSSRKSVEEMRMEIQRDEQAIIKLRQNIKELKSQLAKEVIPEKIKALLERRAQLIIKAEQLMAAFSKKLDRYMKIAEETKNQSFLEFLRDQANRLSEIRAANLSDLKEAKQGEQIKKPAPQADRLPREQDEQEIRRDLEADEKEISGLLSQILTLEAKLAKEISEEIKESLEKQIESLKDRVERQISAFEKKLADRRTLAEKIADSRLVQFIKAQTQNMAEKRANILAKIKQGIEERRKRRAERKAAREAERESERIKKEQEKARKETEQKRQEEEEARKLAAAKTKILNDINALKASIAQLDKEKNTYSKEKKKQVIDSLEGKIKAIEKYAKDTKANKDNQVKDALNEINTLFRKAK